MQNRYTVNSRLSLPEKSNADPPMGLRSDTALPFRSRPARANHFMHFDRWGRREALLRGRHAVWRPSRETDERDQVRREQDVGMGREGNLGGHWLRRPVCL